MPSYQQEVKNVFGEYMYKELRTEVAKGRISQKKAVLLAYKLDESIGGKFENRTKTNSFEYDADAFMEILGDWWEIATEEQQENLAVDMIKILREDLRLVAVASNLEKAKKGPATPAVKQASGEKSQRKRKGDGEDRGLEQNLPKRRREVITSTRFFFKERETIPAPGTKPKSSDQGLDPICTYHSMAKCIQQKLDDHQVDADHDELVETLLKLFGDDRKSRRNPEQLDSKTIKVIERSEKTGQPTGRCFVVTLGVNCQYTWQAPWPIIVPETQKDVRTSSTEILAIGLLQLTPGDPKSNHAVYIKSYNTRTHEVHTINSHGKQGELGPNEDGVLNEKDFYAVCFVGLSFYQETEDKEQMMDIG